MSNPLLGLYDRPVGIEEVDVYLDSDAFFDRDVALINSDYRNGADQINGEFSFGNPESPHEYGWRIDENGDIEIVMSEEGASEIRSMLESDRDLTSSRVGTLGHKIRFHDVRDTDQIDPSHPYHFLQNYWDRGEGQNLEEKINNTLN